MRDDMFAIVCIKGSYLHGALIDQCCCYVCSMMTGDRGYNCIHTLNEHFMFEVLKAFSQTFQYISCDRPHIYVPGTIVQKRGTNLVL